VKAKKSKFPFHNSTCCISLFVSDRRGSISGSSRAGSSSATKPPKKDAIKVLFVSDLHTLSRQQQLELSLLLLSDTYSIPTIFIVSGVEHPLQFLRYHSTPNNTTAFGN
jgi:hypothetical protein